MVETSSSPADFRSRLRLVHQLLVERCSTAHSGRRAANLLQRIEQRLQRPPRLILLGEANAGKTTLANSLIDSDLLTTDIVRNTNAPVLLRYAATGRVHAVGTNGSRRPLQPADMATRSRLEAIAMLEVGLPLDVLKAVEIVDTPGLTTDPAQVARVRRLCGMAHMAVWCTVASQAWRASEVALWTALSGRLAASSILGVTHADALTSADRAKVRHRLEREAGHLFRTVCLVTDGGASPIAGSVSAEGCAAPRLHSVVAEVAADVQTARERHAGAVVRNLRRSLEGA